MFRVTAVNFPQAGESQYEQGDYLIPCFRCGLCCSRYLIRLSLVEARSIADKLGLSWGEFLEKYVDQAYPGAESFVIRRCNGACIFLEYERSNKTRCLIHPSRPSACREWTPSLYRPECQAGLIRYWGLAVSSTAQLQGSCERLLNFRLFLETLASEDRT